MCHRHTLIIGILTVLGVLAEGRPTLALENWPPITEVEKVLKDCPQQPGAPAIYLYREEAQDGNTFITTVYRRLKILTPGGKDYANVEIPFYKGWTNVEGLKARVVRPEGGSREFKGQVFEKTAVRFGRMKVTIKTFALPDVDVGSIIDYRYKIVPDWEELLASDSQSIADSLGWRRIKPEEGGMSTKGDIFAVRAATIDVQEQLFTCKAKLSYTPMTDYIGDIFGHAMGLGFVTRGLKDAALKNVGIRLELELENIPALETEELMPPEEAERMKADFFFCDRRVKTPDEYWKLEGKSWQDAAERFVGKPVDVVAESQQLVSGLNDPIARLKALYERVQKIRNLSYDKPMIRRKRKQMGIKDNHKAADVLRNGYGLRSDITRTFVALARAAGFQAAVIRVAARDDKLFFKDLLSLYEQLDTELAMVKVNNTDKLFDPATPFCPLGLVHWSCTGTVCLHPSDKPPAFSQIPIYPPDTALTQREIALQLDLEGNLTGTAKVSYTGQEALVRRIEYISEDEVEVKKDLEAELTAILPAGARVSLKRFENMANSADMASAEFEISLPGIATTVGERMLLPVSPLSGSGQYPFRHAQRKYPIIFPFPYRAFDDIVITLPLGIKLETVPAPRRNRQASFDYSLACGVENGTKIHLQRELVVKANYFLAAQYATVKSFFDQVKAGDEEQVVLSMEKKNP